MAAQNSALDYFKGLLSSWGLTSLYSDAATFLTDGYNSDEVTLHLQQTKAYQQRFAGNAARHKAGLPVLSPAEYIALEEQYRNVFRQYGLPKGFYDSKESMDGFIGNDISPTEMEDRVKMASDVYYNAAPEVKATWNNWYGQHGAGGAVAAILDPKVAEPLLQQEVTAAGIGGIAQQSGLTADKATAFKAAQQGVTLTQARQAYQDIAGRLPTDTAIGDRFGAPMTQSQEEQESLFGSAAAAQKRRTLYASEGAQFSSSPAAGQGSNDAGSNY